MVFDAFLSQGRQAVVRFLGVAARREVGTQRGAWFRVDRFVSSSFAGWSRTHILAESADGLLLLSLFLVALSFFLPSSPPPSLNPFISPSLLRSLLLLLRPFHQNQQHQISTPTTLTTCPGTITLLSSQSSNPPVPILPLQTSGSLSLPPLPSPTNLPPHQSHPPTRPNLNPTPRLKQPNPSRNLNSVSTLSSKPPRAISTLRRTRWNGWRPSSGGRRIWR